MIDLYRNIKTLRQQRGLSQDELAKLTGYTDRSSVSKIEAGEIDLPQSKIETFARALGTTASDLLGWSENAEKPALDESELPDVTRELISLLRQMTPAEAARARDFVSGILSSRQIPPDHPNPKD